jgi:TetR/AcrR family transcriptional repressor of nem operon
VRSLAAVGLAIGFRSFDQRKPGRNVSRPISSPPTEKISAVPFWNSRTSSGVPESVCAVTWEDARVAVAKPKPKTETDTASKILDVAERLVQVRGFNGFSYADVAEELHVTKASLHYHFAGKAELGEALIGRYASRFNDALARIAVKPIDARAKLDAYARLYTDVLRNERMPVRHARGRVPDPARADARCRPPILRGERGMAGLRARAGERDGSLRLTAPPSEVARMIVSGLEGGMLVARTYGDLARFRASVSRLIGSLTGSAPRGSTKTC